MLITMKLFQITANDTNNAKEVTATNKNHLSLITESKSDENYKINEERNYIEQNKVQDL